MSQTIFTIIVVIIIFNYLLERFLDYKNSTLWSNELPEELKGIYDAEKYRQSQAYKRANDRLSLVMSTVSLVVILLMLFFQGFAYVDDIARMVSRNPIILALLFFGILMLASDIIDTPFSAYDIFVIEEKYGFNKTTLGTFISDKLKGWLIAAVIGGGLLSLIVWFFGITKENFWIYAWGAVAIFSIFMNMFYSTLIVPLFNKQTPLEEGELRDAIEQLAEKAGFKLKDIFVLDSSKRSTKANAYFIGFGPKKRIVLYDTLIDDLETDEIVAVLAHEIGHYKKKHGIWGLIISILQAGVTFYILSILINNPILSEALGAKVPSFHIGLVTFGILYSPISTILGLGMNIFARRNEYQADEFVKSFNYEDKLISALKKLSVNTLSNLTPHPLYVFFNYSHPTLLQRIKAIKS
jgi:STE24 endopeptidase